jgi:ABC-type antimicrobial peptide transport system permease subunit
MAATLLSIFGLLALSLAELGLYGVMAYSVSQRTRELGIRISVGAKQRDVLKLVLGQTLVLAAIGIAGGLVTATAVTRFASNLLYGISPADPATFALIAVLLFVVSLVAGYFPARRATRIDPMIALRSE